eukprot:scaffold67117_cov42-Phaeocystis_antarctica.AAC.1
MSQTQTILSAQPHRRSVLARNRYASPPSRSAFLLTYVRTYLLTTYRNRMEHSNLVSPALTLTPTLTLTLTRMEHSNLVSPALTLTPTLTLTGWSTATWSAPWPAPPCTPPMPTACRPLRSWATRTARCGPNPNPHPNPNPDPDPSPDPNPNSNPNPNPNPNSNPNPNPDPDPNPNPNQARCGPPRRSPPRTSSSQGASPRT